MNKKLAALVLAFVSTVALAYAVNPTGTWGGELHTREGGAFEVTLNLKATGDKVEGTFGQGQSEDVKIENGKLAGDTVTFSISRHNAKNNQDIKINYTGKIEGNNM